MGRPYLGNVNLSLKDASLRVAQMMVPHATNATTIGTSFTKMPDMHLDRERRDAVGADKLIFSEVDASAALLKKVAPNAERATLNSGTSAGKLFGEA